MTVRWSPAGLSAFVVAAGVAAGANDIAMFWRCAHEATEVRFEGVV